MNLTINTNGEKRIKSGGIIMEIVRNVSNVDQPNADYNSNSGSTIESESFSSYLREEKSLNQIFDEAAKKYHVSADLLKAVGKTESDYRVHVVSKCGAQGIMQLMPATAEELGVTDPFDAEQNIMGGAKYISQLLDKYDGDTKLALAAYNAGMGNVAKYGGVPPFEETQNYVVKVTNYMKQGVDAGNMTAKVSAETSINRTVPNASRNLSVSDRSGSNASVFYPFLSMQQAVDLVSNNTKESLTSAFSYDDYIKFISLLLDEQNEQSDESNKPNYDLL